MISHEHKCIFVHIPKTAGMSILSFFYPNIHFHHTLADYDRLFGWCPKRKIHMQHATSKQLLETGLITEDQWNDYFKFTFVRNPWDRAYSDYRWIQEFTGIKGSFMDYLSKKGKFSSILNNDENWEYLGDHLLPQSTFFDIEGEYELDYIGRFENFNSDINRILEILKIEKDFNAYQNTSRRRKDYSLFYTKTYKQMVGNKFHKDVELFGYEFVDNKKGIQKIKNLF